MLFKEINPIYTEKHMKLIKYAILPIFKADGAYSYHWA
jgi:hypothetical protein